MDDSSFATLMQNPGYLWSVAAVGFMLLEAFGLPGVGLMFAGIGALMVGLSIFAHVILLDDYTLQLIVFFTFSVISALLLWKPLQRFRVGRGRGEYSNIVGGTAYVGAGGISRKHGGEVTWSGTIMRAELARSCPVELVDAGAAVVITEVHNATLVVTPKD